MKQGTFVAFDGGKGKDDIAFIANVGEDTRHDLIVFDTGTGASSFEKEVPRRDEGGGRTWKPLKN